MKLIGIKKFLKQLLCRHRDLSTMYICYGDAISGCRCRPEFYCKKCGKTISK